MEDYIDQLHAQIRSKRIANLGVRYASLLDVRLIGHLLKGGTFEGAFTDQFMRENGPVKLYVHLARVLLQQWVGKLGQSECLVVIYSGDRDIGLLHLACSGRKVGGKTYTINMIAMLHAYRRLGHAEPILESMIDLLSQGSTLQAFCNRHSKAFQQALKNLAFFRRNEQPQGLFLYTFRK